MLQRADLTEPEVLRHSVLDFRQMSSFIQNPLIFERADGVHYWDIHGKHYYDGISGIFVVTIGHNNRRVIEAMRSQMDRICFAAPLHGTNVPAVELCALLARLAPGDLNVVKLLSGGSEATETAMKLARQYWKQAGIPSKYKFISRYQGYHGATLGAMAASGAAKRRIPFEPLPSGYIHVPTVHCYRCPFDQEYPACRTLCARHIERVIALEGPETVAGLIVEPIGNTGGILVPTPDYLPILRRICDQYDVLLIFDEMITGMGRTGRLFAAETFGVNPDVLCLGKGLSSGYAPLAATIWTDRIHEAFLGPDEAGIEFGHGHTYAGSPVAAAAGIASVSEIIERDLPGRAISMGDALHERLEEMGQRLGVFGEVRGKGLLWGVELARDPATKEPFPPEQRLGKRIGQEAQDRGLIIRHDPDWFALAPPLTVSEDELHAMCAILEDSIRAALTGL